MRQPLFPLMMISALFVAALCGAPGRAEAQGAGLKVENPDKRLWRLKNEGALFQDDITYQCVHSLCPPLTSFNAGEAKGPAKRPGKNELQSIATRDLPNALAKSGQPKSPPKITQTTIKGWPALRGTYAISSGDREIGIAFAEIHMDGSVVLLRAASGDRAFAPRALDAFLENVTLRSP